jgi:hypothetical protein
MPRGEAMADGRLRRISTALVKKIGVPVHCCSMGAIPGNGDVAVDARTDMVDGNAGRRRGGGVRFTYDAERVKVVAKDFAGRVDFIAQNIRTSRFWRPGVSAEVIKSPTASVTIVDQAFRTRRSPIRATSWPSGRSASGRVDESHRRSSRQGRRQSCCSHTAGRRPENGVA